MKTEKVTRALETLHEELGLYAVEVAGWEVYSRGKDFGGGWCVQELPSEPWTNIEILPSLDAVAAFLVDKVGK